MNPLLNWLSDGGGMDVGGVYMDGYDVFATGGALGFAFNSGRIGARNALKYMRQG